MNPIPEIQALQDRFKEIYALRAAAAIMHWDQATYLPEGGAEARGQHLAVIEKLSHEMSTSDEFGKAIEAARRRVSDLDPHSNEARLVDVAHRDFEKNARLPAAFCGEVVKHVSHSYEVWRKARAANDFKLIEDIMKNTLDLSLQWSEYLREPSHASPMDPMIDGSDPEFTVANLKPLFSTLRRRLVPLLERITAEGPFENKCLLQAFPESEQLRFGEDVIRKLGYDFKNGRQDKTTHPFMIRFAAKDVRITTRVNPNDVSDALFSTIHEAGHALYEQGVDPQFDSSPLGGGTSSGVHESQSRFWENLIARSLPFWEHFYPELQATFSKQLGGVSLREFHKAINRVERSLIRTDADEVSYNLHVMIRFDLECEMLEGRLSIRDLPEAWNARYRSDLGVTPPTVSQGVLQDVHWFGGTIGGAFQGYTIGNVLSGQLWATAMRELPGLEDKIRKGDFAPIREWLRLRLHQHGRKYEGPEMIRRATGRDLEAEDYLRYLESKYETLLGS